MRKIIIYILLTSLLLHSQSAYANSNYGEWASASINNAISRNIITKDVTHDYYSPITRREIAQIIKNSYINLKGNQIISDHLLYSDTTDPSVIFVSELKIMNGYGDGTFLPDATTSRQEMAKILLTFKSALTNTPINLLHNDYCNLTDYENLSEWAKPYVTTAIKSGLLNGYEDGSFGGLRPVSWQEAIVMIERVSNLFETNLTTKKLSADFNLKVNVNNQTANISWNKLNSDTHILTITEQRMSRYEGDIPPNDPVVLNFDNQTSYSFEVNPIKKYKIKISNGNYYFETDFFTRKLYFEDMDEITATYPTSQEEAENLVIDVTVPVWRLNGSTKAASSATFKVHYAIADKVKLIFEEIFNGEEKFPIKDVGGYNWRGSRSEHNGGTAIDINSNENYCIYNNGTKIGSHWTPYEDPYSITPYGDVIRAFEKYGFTWGGDSWSNPKDYMHFSYLGT